MVLRSGWWFDIVVCWWVFVVLGCVVVVGLCCLVGFAVCCVALFGFGLGCGFVALCVGRFVWCFVILVGWVWTRGLVCVTVLGHVLLLFQFGLLFWLFLCFEFASSGMVLILRVADFLGGVVSLHGGVPGFVSVLLCSVWLVVV